MQEEEVRTLKELVRTLEKKAIERYYQIQELQVKTATQEEQMTQLMQANNDYLMKIAKHQKRGIPYCNRTMECLSFRLKMPQLTCITM